MDNMRKNIRNMGRNQKHYSLKFLVISVICVAIVSSLLTAIIIGNIGNIKAFGNRQLSDIINTYQKIINDYYAEVDEEDLATSAIDGMMNLLEEKYSIYMDGENTSELNDKLNGYYEGVGISVAKSKDGNIYVLNVYDNTPALNVGIKAGDQMIEVNGNKITKDTESTDITEIIKKNKDIHIKVKREDKILGFDLHKDNILYPVVGSQVFKKNDKAIGYIELTSFNSSSDKQVKSALEKVESENIDSLILDLRGNSGGYLTMATNIANMFLKKGKIIYSLEGKNTYNIVKDTTDEERKYDIVVLVDSLTASASEILAAALKESYGAIIVGTNSYGKGKVQQTSNLSDDRMIKYTTAKWFTPRGDNIDAIGLKPGVEVKLTVDYLKNPIQENDAQLLKAIELLSKEKNTVK